jgi:hypothetical protein
VLRNTWNPDNRNQPMMTWPLEPKTQHKLEQIHVEAGQDRQGGYAEGF